MCWTRKCCLCLNVNTGAVIFAICSYTFSFIVCVASGLCLKLEDNENVALMATQNTTHPIQSVFGVQLKVINIKVILVTTFVTSLLTTLFSMLLIIGIVKNQPGLLLSYFFYGIMTTILMQLGCLLVLLEGYWYISLVWFACTLVYIHCLMVVYTVQESMQRGRQFSFKVDDMEEELLN